MTTSFFIVYIIYSPILTKCDVYLKAEKQTFLEASIGISIQHTIVITMQGEGETFYEY